MLMKEGLFSNIIVDSRKEYLKFQGSCFYDGIVKCKVLKDTIVVEGFEDKSVGSGRLGKISGSIPITSLEGVYNIIIWLEDNSGNILEKVQVIHVVITDKEYKNQSSYEEEKASIELESISYREEILSKKAQIILTYKNTAGGLVLQGAGKGFQIKLAPRLMDYGQITEVKTEGNTILLNTSIAYQGPNDISLAFLSYEYPKGETDKITDSLGRPIPEMDMVRVVSQGFMTPYINVWQVSRYEPLKEDFKNLRYPSHLSEEEFYELQFPGWYCELKEQIEIGGHTEAGSVIYFAGRVLCEEENSFCLQVGSGGEHKLKVWFDEKEVLLADNTSEGRVKLLLEPGIHKLTIALGLSEDKAPGIYARLEKLNYPRGDANIVKTHPKFPVFLRKGYKAGVL